MVSGTWCPAWSDPVKKCSKTRTAAPKGVCPLEHRGESPDVLRGQILGPRWLIKTTALRAYLRSGGQNLDLENQLKVWRANLRHGGLVWSLDGWFEAWWIELRPGRANSRTGGQKFGWKCRLRSGGQICGFGGLIWSLNVQWRGRRMDALTEGRKDGCLEIHPCVLRNIGPLEPLQRREGRFWPTKGQRIMPGRSNGTD